MTLHDVEIWEHAGPESDADMHDAPTRDGRERSDAQMGRRTTGDAARPSPAAGRTERVDPDDRGGLDRDVVGPGPAGRGEPGDKGQLDATPSNPRANRGVDKAGPRSSVTV
jgi:hypothetical protein